MTTIPREEVRFSRLSLVDDIGRVFAWNDRLYRGILPIAAARTRTLLESSFLAELIKLGAFPPTTPTNLTLEGFAFVVEHHRVPCVTFPHEWSFEMLRDASLLVLSISELAMRHGWTMKDCHPYNILFDGTHPIYVDLGTFIPSSGPAMFDRGIDFLTLFWRPLLFWASGDAFLAQRILSSAHETLPELSWRLRQSALLRALGDKSAAKVVRQWNRVGNRISRLLQKIRAGDIAAPGVSCFPVDFVTRSPALLRLKVVRLRAPNPASAWHSYQNEYFANQRVLSTPRFTYIADLVRQLGCSSVVELAGNRGLLSLLLLARTQVRSVICTDNDQYAVDQLYRHVRDQPDAVPPGKILHSATLNFMIPEVNYFTSTPAERFQAELVTALAVTHHLTLSQGFPLSEVMGTIAAYTRRFAMIEFMPLGLWDGRTAPPTPGWYTAEWFQDAFTRHFKLLSVAQLEPNRVLYLGSRR